MSKFSPKAGDTIVRGEVSSTDASLGVEVTLYDVNGDEVTLGETERLVITDFALVSVAGGNCALTVDTDEAGSRLVKGTLAAKGVLTLALVTPLYCPVGTVPKLFAAAGQVDLSICGFVALS